MIKLFVNSELANFLELKVSKHIDNLAGSFSAKVLKPFSAGDIVKIKVGKKVVLDGYVDVSNSSLTIKGKSFEIHGRDKTGDLVDSCLKDLKTYKDEPLADIASSLVKDFKIEIEKAPKDKIKYTPTPGVKVFKALADLGIKKDMRVISKAGKLKFTKLDPSDSPSFRFSEGENILVISLVEDHRERFKNYIARTKVGGLSENYNYDSIIVDPEIKRERTLLFNSEQDLENECKFQKDLRKSNSKIINLTAYGFIQNDKVPDILDLVLVVSGSLSIDDAYYIVGLSFKYDKEQKKLINLELAERGAFKKKEKEESGSW